MPVTQRPELWGYALAALVVVSATALGIAGHTVPGELWLLGGVSAGGSAGATMPKGRTK